VVPDALADALRAIGVREPLEEIARLQNRRELWTGTLDGVSIEVCLDTVTVEYPTHSSFFEVEVEAPERAVLDAIAEAIDQRFPDVPPSVGSKLHAALEGSVDDPHRSSRTAVAPQGDGVGTRLATLLAGRRPMLAPWT
jgi:hypothetical protein